jgi:hypothetical protein
MDCLDNRGPAVRWDLTVSRILTSENDGRMPTINHGRFFPGTEIFEMIK